MDETDVDLHKIQYSKILTSLTIGLSRTKHVPLSNGARSGYIDYA